MPEAVEQLPTVQEALEHVDAIPSASLFLEVFSGECIFTLAVMLTGWVCLRPWDIRFGSEDDVLAFGDAILRLARTGKLGWVHLATPCQTFTFARVPQLREAVFPLGSPGISTRQQMLVDVGNSLASFSVNVAQAQISVGTYFSIENPELSWLWVLPCIQGLRSHEHVGFVRCLFRDFGVPFTKPTLFLHNSPCLHKLGSCPLAWEGKTISLRGTVVWEGRTVFKTHLAQTYPPLLGVKFAECVAQSLDERAALGQAVNVQQGVDLPGALLEAERQQQELLQSSPVPHGLGALPGLSPLEHVAFGLQVAHPSENPAPLCAEMLGAIQFECEHSVDEIDNFRQEKLFRITQLHAVLKELQVDWVKQAPRPITAAPRGVHSRPLVEGFAG